MALSLLMKLILRSTSLHWVLVLKKFFFLQKVMRLSKNRFIWSSFKREYHVRPGVGTWGSSWRGRRSAGARWRAPSDSPQACAGSCPSFQGRSPSPDLQGEQAQETDDRITERRDVLKHVVEVLSLAWSRHSPWRDLLLPHLVRDGHWLVW